jgi:hypothetical protein
MLPASRATSVPVKKEATSNVSKALLHLFVKNENKGTIFFASWRNEIVLKKVSCSRISFAARGGAPKE